MYPNWEELSGSKMKTETFVNSSLQYFFISNIFLRTYPWFTHTEDLNTWWNKYKKDFWYCSQISTLALLTYNITNDRGEKRGDRGKERKEKEKWWEGRKCKNDRWQENGQKRRGEERQERKGNRKKKWFLTICFLKSFYGRKTFRTLLAK